MTPEERDAHVKNINATRLAQNLIAGLIVIFGTAIHDELLEILSKLGKMEERAEERWKQ